MKSVLTVVFILILPFLAAASEPAAPRTHVELRENRWYINDRLTNPGSRAEGLLMNVRMVNAVFEDRHRPDFDAEANTDRFLAHLDDYAAHGVNAFTICLQGGGPGYEGALNSAFTAEGRLREDYLRRVSRVLRACDQRGLVIILGLFYQRQSGLLKDDTALRTAVVNATQWVQASGFRHVLIEIANEYTHKGFAHALIRDPKGQASLIRLAKQTAPGLLISASGYGDGKIDPEVAEASDFLLPHWNGTPVDQIGARLAVLQRHGKAIVCNEDARTGREAVAAMKATINGGASYGLMLERHNQHFPFHFEGAADDPVFYSALKAATTRRQAQTLPPAHP